MLQPGISCEEKGEAAKKEASRPLLALKAPAEVVVVATAAEALGDL